VSSIGPLHRPSIVSFTQDRADETGDGCGGIVTAKTPLARYGAVEGALASGFGTRRAPPLRWA
jgi:hypothetical protein